MQAAPAQLAQCGEPAPLFAYLRSVAAQNPALAFACSAALPAAQQDFLLREAFLAAATRDPDLARRYLPTLIHRPWLTDAGFFTLAALAVPLRDYSAPLLTQAARRFPELALREYRGYIELPCGQSVFEAAAAAAPDEAVGLASGSSSLAAGLLQHLAAGASPQLETLTRIARDGSLNTEARARLAVFSLPIARGDLSYAQAAQQANGPDFFAAVVELRLNARSPQESAIYDRVLAKYAEVLFRTTQDAGAAPLTSELKRLRARDVYLLLTYGRTEEDDLLFGSVFDRFLAPKLRATPPSKLLAEVRDLNLRRFLATAAMHHRLDAFLHFDANPSALLAQAMRGVDQAAQPLDEALAAAEVLASLGSSRSRVLAPVLAAEYQRSPQAQPYYGLLLASLPAEARAEEPARAIAADYLPYFQQPRVLNTAALFDPTGLCVQAQFFYDDDDAAESFASFQQIYQRDPAWHWEDHGWYVLVTSQAGHGRPGRAIRIYANVPHSAQSPGSDDRRHALALLLREQSLTPTVLIHRGHTWYVDQSLRYLTPAARLGVSGQLPRHGERLRRYHHSQPGADDRHPRRGYPDHQRSSAESDQRRDPPLARPPRLGIVLDPAGGPPGTQPRVSRLRPAYPQRLGHSACRVLRVLEF